MKNEKMWAMLVHLTINTVAGRDGRRVEELRFDDELWGYIVDEAEKAGLNTIVLDVGDGIEYASHPEISVKNAWSKKRVHDEIKRCREKGIRLIPKLNFATIHSFWLGEYLRMTSTNVYYKVCNDIIKELYEVFEHPEYIHIGFDEEDAEHVKNQQFAIYRQGDLFWHDMRFIMDCVLETGAKPWIWSCSLFNHPEDFKKHINSDEVIISPWYYNAFRPEHWTPIESRKEYVDFYSHGEYAKMNLKFVEEDPFFVRFREVALPLMKEEGYKYVPTASVYNRCDWNTHDLVEYFKLNAPDEQVLGFMTAPWHKTYPENKHYYEESFKFIKEAKEKFYK